VDQDENDITPVVVQVDTCYRAHMAKSMSRPTMTDVLRTAICESGVTPYRIAQATGILGTSLSRFLSGQTSLRLDKADKLAAYLGLQLAADPDAKLPEPTPKNLARPMLSRGATERKAK
jgi:transcriptional regulator with XRE-family HTH domain